MLLVKCKCGCCFTIEDDVFQKRAALNCFNCDNSTGSIGDTNFMKAIDKINLQEFKVSVIPDNATLEVRFNI